MPSSPKPARTTLGTRVIDPPHSLFSNPHIRGIRSAQQLPPSGPQGASPGNQQVGRIMVEPAGEFWKLSSHGRAAKAARKTSRGQPRWTASAKSARLTGLYLIVAGMSLLIAPKSTFGKWAIFCDRVTSGLLLRELTTSFLFPCSKRLAIRREDNCHGMDTSLRSDRRGFGSVL